MKQFVSIRTKLIANNMIFISLIFFVVLSVVVAINIRSLNQNMAKSERNIRNSLIVKGNTLINNNSMAMTGMAEDNAFTAIRNLISANIKDDPDIIYGIYMDINRVAWAYASPENPSGRPKDDAPLSDEISQWAGALTAAEHKIFLHQGREVIEFASPIFIEGRIFGFIRYGISTESMNKLLQEALSDGNRTRNMTILILFLLGVGSLMASYGIVRRLSVKIIKNIEYLVESATIIASGDYDTPVVSDSNDELGLLVADVDKMRLAIKDLTENLEGKVEERTRQLQESNEKLEAAMKALWGEMELARKIQTCLLPNAIENIHPDFEIAATMQTADEVGGDFYEITSDREGNLWLAVGDVSGHGVTPGLIMMMAQTIHATVTTCLDCDARALVIKINEILYKNVNRRLGETHFMTFTALKYLGKGRFQFAGAHLSIIVYRKKTGRCEMIRTNGVYLNFKADISRGTKNADFALNPGDTLVLYTDGITEAVNAEGQLLDIKGLAKIVEVHADNEPQIMKEMLMTDVNLWCGGKRADDMSIVIVRRKGGENG